MLNKKWNLLLVGFGILSLVACKKETDKIITDTKRDTITTVEKPVDTLSAILATRTEANQLILDVDGTSLPIRLVEEIKNPEQQIIVRLLNYDKSNLKAFIKSDKEMNIRINQIRMPDNTFDGPFSQTIDYKTPQKGEYWLVLSKNNMASGNPLGKFFLKVE